MRIEEPRARIVVVAAGREVWSLARGALDPRYSLERCSDPKSARARLLEAPADLVLVAAPLPEAERWVSELSRALPGLPLLALPHAPGAEEAEVLRGAGALMCLEAPLSSSQGHSTSSGTR